MRVPRTMGTAYYQAWNAAIRLGEFSYSEVGEAAAMSPSTVSRFVCEWVAQGLAEKLGRGSDGKLRCRIIDPEAHKPLRARADGSLTRQQTLHGNMWTVMRGLREFSPLDVAAHARTDQLDVTEEHAREYCRMLVLSGYLKVLRKAQPGRKPAVYRLMRNTGPRPPRERRVRAVYDDNTGEFAYVAGVAI